MATFSNKWFIFLSLVSFTGCAYRQTQPGYGGTYGSDSQVISAPAYTASPTPSSQIPGPPIYSGAGTGTQANTNSSVEVDRSLVSRVQQSLRSSDLAGSAPNINVSAYNGAVALTGYVPTERERALAETLAKNTPGAVSVDNEIRVLSTPNAQASYPNIPSTVSPGNVSSTPPSPAAAGSTMAAGDIFNLHVQGLNDTDRVLAQRILQGLRTDSTLNTMLPSVTIHVAGGRVVLQGQVQSDQQRQTIDSVVRQAAGVNNVEDQLQVYGVGGSSSP